MNFILNMFFAQKCTKKKVIINSETAPEESENIDESLLSKDSSYCQSINISNDDEHNISDTKVEIDQSSLIDRDENVNNVQKQSFDCGNCILSDQVHSDENKRKPLIDTPPISTNNYIDAMLDSVFESVTNDYYYRPVNVVQEHCTNAFDAPLNQEVELTNLHSIQENYNSKQNTSDTDMEDSKREFPELMNNELTKCISDSMTLLNNNDLVCLQETPVVEKLEHKPTPFNFNIESKDYKNSQSACNDKTNNSIYIELGTVPIEKAENVSVITEYDDYSTKLLEDLQDDDSMVGVECLSDISLETLNLELFEEITNQTSTQHNIFNNEAIETISISSSSPGNNSLGTEPKLKMSLIEPIMDTISISSEETLATPAKDDTDDDYHSSDFEFITESDAELDSLLINFPSTKRQPQTKDSPTVSTVEICKVVKRVVKSNYGAPNLPGPSNASLYERYSTKPNPQDFQLDVSYRANHRIPDRNEYIHLFQCFYNPRVISGWQNKAIDYGDPPSDAMLVEFEGVGFDMQILSARNRTVREIDKEVNEEAKATAKKILEMYPDDNKKRRRRF